MVCATKFFVLLSTPFPLVRLSRHHHKLFLSSSLLSSSFHNLTSHSTPLLPHSSSSPINSSNHHHRLHNQAASSLRTDYLGDPSLAPHHVHPWSEWSNFIQHLSASGYFHHPPPDDDFLAAGELTHLFLREARACLAFARDRKNIFRLLSRRDIEVVVQHGSPFLFPNAEDSVRKMRSFISNTATTVPDSDKANMVDLMKFMLSYASNPLASSERERTNLHNIELVESSVRNLFAQLFKLICNLPGSISNSGVQNQIPGRYGQKMAPGPKIEMKRGDWVCPRCNFMNFARNVKCLECEESRPRRQLTGGEWECPQCDFYNYGKNMTCMRCDCKRPGQISLGAPNASSGLGYGNRGGASTSTIDNRLAANEEKAQRWFSKVSQLESTADINSVISDEDFPEIMPLRKGVNRFVVSTRKTPLERRLSNTQYKKNLGNDGTPEFDDFQAGDVTELADASVSQSLDNVLGRPTGVSQTENRSVVSGHKSNSDSYRDVKGSYSSHDPFSEDMFAQKTENLTAEDSGDNSQLSNAPTSQFISKDKEKEQDEKSERWFKKVAEMHNNSDFTSAISEEDFPEIMPMRKGENRFVVSKKKDRSLTSPAYKRQLAMEQASNINYVPFVPFPPDYFAKKDKQPSDGADSADKPNIESSSISEVAEKLPEISGQGSSDNYKGATYGATTSGNSNQNYEELGNKFSRNESKDQISNVSQSSSMETENQNIRAQWTGKSLEGSAVKEPDPLDMSEEAKAERWFRRVAQIKDISELSQIPDEDFPSIMPMRKGVNRFVVSKRKTPLERRLTSQQYRKNLPIVSSDPIKKENDGS